MKKSILLSTLCLFLFSSGFAQPIPEDSLYMGQIPPDNTPKIFHLPLSSGYFSGAKIDISVDNKIIYFNEMNGYGSGYTSRINSVMYSDEKWTGPYNLFTGYQQPVLSITGDTMYMDESDNPGESLFFSFIDNTSWNIPVDLNLDISSQGSIVDALHSGSNISLKGLNYPMTFALYGNELYLSRDYLYFLTSEVVTGNAGDIFISYNKTDTTWTNLKDLGPLINTSDWEFAPYVSPDNKYLFFVRSSPTAGTSTYWVKIDNLIEQLRYTNFVPYVISSVIMDQTGEVGSLFTYSIPNTAFIDDDGNNTLTYSAALSNGANLPSWLDFNSSTITFSGIPIEADALNLKVTATDTAMASVSATFSLIIIDFTNSICQTDIQDILVYPNPAINRINISFGTKSYNKAVIEIYNIYGKLLSYNIYQNSREATIDMSYNPKGIYFIKVSIEGTTLIKKIILN